MMNLNVEILLLQNLNIFTQIQSKTQLVAEKRKISKVLAIGICKMQGFEPGTSGFK